MFKEKYPLAWSYHFNSCRNEFNTILPQNASSTPESYKEYPHAKKTYLPQAHIPEASFSNLLFERFSCRKFKNEALSLQQLSNILFAGYGVREVVISDKNELMERTVPSGGGLYSLELYVLITNVEELEPGIYHYTHTPPLLELINPIKLPKPFLQQLFMDQPYVADAPAIVIITSCINRTMKKYFDRGYRYILFEAGHAMQNMNLATTACNAGSVNVGGFFDEDVCKVLAIEMEEEIPLYAMAAGVPEGDSAEARIPK